jgi:hypothetical protein
VLTNAQRAGSAYDILLVDPAGQIVARTAATLPTRKVGELGLELPLISASDTAVYYLDGNTDIRSLSPSGATADVMAIPDGAAAEIAFAVSPDGRRIAITELTERPDPSKDSSEAYIEDLRSGSNRVWLWTDNRGGSATRWPVGWHGNSLIDAIYPNQCPHGQCLGLRTPNGYNPPGAYHVFDSTTGNVSATVCQSPPPPSNSIYADYYNAEGLPTASGTACYEILQGGNTGNGTYWQEYRLTDVDWSGAEHIVLRDARDEEGCSLSPDGTRIACMGSGPSGLIIANTNGTVTKPDLRKSTTASGTILGWIDQTHLLVDLDNSDLALIAPDSAAVIKVFLPNANDAVMVATLPGSL